MMGIILIILTSLNTLFCFNLSSGRWSDATATVLFSSTMGAQNSTDLKDDKWIDLTMIALSRWTMIDGASFSVVHSTEDCGNNCAIGNNKNEFYWVAPDEPPLNIPAGALAVTFRRQFDNNMVEVDIVINKSFDHLGDSGLCIWGTPGNTNCFDFPSVVTHEIGHLFGLDHSSEDPSISVTDPRRTATMYYRLNATGPLLIPLKADDNEGMICLYPASGEPYKVAECCESYNPFDRAPGCSHAFSEKSTQSLDIGGGTAGCGSIDKVDSKGSNNTNRLFLILSVVLLPMFILLFNRFILRNIGKRT
ncbi:MAG: matrixin family metalloprotease [bacterium]